MTFISQSNKNYKWWVLIAMSSCVSTLFLDQTVLPVALPSIQRGLEVSELGLQWLVNAYLLALTAFVLAGGRIGDIFGHRKFFCIGLGIFSAASILCGFSFSETWFILSRTLQGVGAALLLPSATAILVNAFPLKERGKALGIYVGVGSVFLTLGPFIGGIITQYLDWRYVFWINIPIAAVGLILSLLVVPKSEPQPEPFDFLGFFAFSIGIIALVVALMQRATWGWTSPLTLGLLILGVVLMVLLCLVDRKTQHPFIDFNIFKNRLFTGAILCVFFTQFLLMVTIFWAIYFQNILGLTPLTVGTVAVASNFPVIIFAPLGGYMLDKYGPRIPISLGFVLLILSLLWFSFFTKNENILYLLPGLVPLGCGVPLIFSPCFTTAMSSVPASQRGAASGISTTFRQFAATLGMAVIGTLFIYSEQNHLAALFAENSSIRNFSPSDFEGLLSQAPGAVAALSTLPFDIAELIRREYAIAFEAAFSFINFVASGIAVLGLLCGVIFMTKELKEPEPAHHD